MFHLFHGATADDIWLQAASLFCQPGSARPQASRCGPTWELDHAAICVADPRQRWVVSRHPPMNPAFALAEIVWIMNGRNDAAFVNYFNRQLPKYAGDGPTYDGAYGHRLRKQLGIDQLERAYQALRGRPDSRQVVLQIWDGRVDFPAEDGTPVSADIPCNVVSLLKVREDALDWTQVIRSNDFFLGLPYNLVQFTTLQEVMAGWLGVKLGSFHVVTDSLHLYEKNLGDVRAAHRPGAPTNCDDLALPKEASEQAFRELALRTEEIVDHSCTAGQLQELLCDSQLPRSFRNILCVLTAEGIRRRRRPEVAERCVEACANPLLRQLMERWFDCCRERCPRPACAPRRAAD